MKSVADENVVKVLSLVLALAQHVRGVALKQVAEASGTALFALCWEMADEGSCNLRW